MRKGNRDGFQLFGSSHSSGAATRSHGFPTASVTLAASRNAKMAFDVYCMKKVAKDLLT